MRTRYGVICYIPGKKQNDVVLVTSRRSKSWIFPKGRRIVGMSGAASAEREAYEEAGLRGRVDKRRRYRVLGEQAGQKVTLWLYPMRVDKVLKHWPEVRLRSRLITTPQKAEKLLDCRDTIRAMRKVMKKVRP